MSERARDLAIGVRYCEYVAGMVTLLVRGILAKSHR